MFNIFLLLNLDYPDYINSDLSVYDKNLVIEKMTAKAILENYNFVALNSSSKLLSKPNPKQSLTFVTPWNSVGYDLLLNFGGKFSYVVPTWLTYDCSSSTPHYIGLDVVNETWLKLMKEQHPNTKILVRLAVLSDFSAPLLDGRFVKDTINVLKEVSKSNLIDGFYLENQQLFQNEAFIKQIHSHLRQFKKAFPGKCTIGIDIPIFYRIDYNNQNVQKLLKTMIKDFDFFYIAAYEIPTTLSPLSVMDKIISSINNIDSKLKEKLIIGLPFFGFKINQIQRSKNYIFGDEIIQILHTNPAYVTWLHDSHEHIIAYRNDKIRTTIQIEYPSLKFFDDRIVYVKTLPILGLGFWEIAQGLPYFFDTL